MQGCLMKELKIQGAATAKAFERKVSGFCIAPIVIISV